MSMTEIKKRQYHGEAEAKELVEWLNWVAAKGSSVPHRMALERVLGIKEAILQLQDKAQKMMDAGTWKGKSKEFKREEEAVNRKLNDYRFAYALDLSKQEPMVWTMCGSEDLPSTPVPRETIAVFHVVELAKLSVLDKVRKCKCGDCDKYFFARRPEQHFHAAKCRIRFGEASPERKQRKREQARQRYHLHKSGKVATHKDYVRKSRKVRG